MSSIQIVVDGMFGSCGKGHVAGQLAARLKNPLIIRTGGPNAGHTWRDAAGRDWKLRQLPTAVISNPDATLAISARSLIDPEVLEQELSDTVAYNSARRLIVDPAATVIEPRHKEMEAIDAGLVGWSTQKGIGAARADRVMRRAQTAAGQFGRWPLASVNQIAVEHAEQGDSIIIETAQGYGLGLHTPYYPKTTSADCRAIDALADVGISPWDSAFRRHRLRVWVVLRPFPIRVAGDSGPLHLETSWENLGLPQERTTVTNKVRRVGEWDSHLVAQALNANGAPSPSVVVALTMMDQVIPELAGMTTQKDLEQLSAPAAGHLRKWLTEICWLESEVKAIGTGPRSMVFLDDGAEESVPADSAIHRGGE